MIDNNCIDFEIDKAIFIVMILWLLDNAKKYYRY